MGGVKGDVESRDVCVCGRPDRDPGKTLTVRRPHKEKKE